MEDFWMHSLSEPKDFPSLWESSSFLLSPDVGEVYTQFIWSVYIIDSPGPGSAVIQLDQNSPPWMNKKIARNTFSRIHKDHKGLFFLQMPEKCRSHHWYIIQFFSLLPLILFPNTDFVLFAQETKKIQAPVLSYSGPWNYQIPPTSSGLRMNTFTLSVAWGTSSECVPSCDGCPCTMDQNHDTGETPETQFKPWLW